MILFPCAFVLRRLLALALTMLVAANFHALADGSIPSGPTLSLPGSSEESAFLTENEAAMNKMMADMEIKPSGDVDRDFVEMMIPHHQGAIDMAQAVLQ